jgi:DeoR/GlpR family transcriptional regulator of sugar metabolism
MIHAAKRFMVWERNMKKSLKLEELLFAELEKRQTMKSEEIGALLGVSPSTVRRICIRLSEQKRAVRVIGGVQLVKQDPFPEYSYARQMTLNIEEKRAIGRRASLLVENGDIIFVNSGTTTFHFVSAMVERIRNNELSGVVMVTNAIDNAMLILEGLTGIQIILTGGEYYPRRRDLAGVHCEQTIRSLRFHKFFTGVDSLNTQDGLMVLDARTANIDRIASERSDQVIVLADHMKFGNHPYISYSELDPKHIIVTDQQLDAESRRQLSEGSWTAIYV